MSRNKVTFPIKDLVLEIRQSDGNSEFSIICPIGATVCNGTSADDIIEGTTDNAEIHGLGGNDYIYGYRYGANYIFGEDGNDILIG